MDFPIIDFSETNQSITNSTLFEFLKEKNLLDNLKESHPLVYEHLINNTKPDTTEIYARLNYALTKNQRQLDLLNEKIYELEINFNNTDSDFYKLLREIRTMCYEKITVLKNTPDNILLEEGVFYKEKLV